MCAATWIGRYLSNNSGDGSDSDSDSDSDSEHNNDLERRLMAVVEIEGLYVALLLPTLLPSRRKHQNVAGAKAIRVAALRSPGIS